MKAFSGLQKPDCISGNPLPLDEVLRLIQTRIAPISDVETVSLNAAVGRILAETARARSPVPPEARSAMDGYALRASDIASMAIGGLPISARVHAGHPFSGNVARATCARIMTGAVLPMGLDLVVPQENVQVDEAGIVKLLAGEFQAGSNVRLPGEDIFEGEEVLQEGRRLRISDIGVLASLGIDTVTVRRRVRVALFTTGDELRSLGKPLASGEIYDSNRYTLTGLLMRDGCEVIDLGIIPDDLDRTKAVLEEAARVADVAISTAGVSVGDADVVKEAVGSLGGVELWGVALKMGRPLVFGHIGQCWYFGLAGNPVSAMINYLEVVRPGLLHLASAQETRPSRYQVESGEELELRQDREEYRRAVLTVDGDGVQRVYGLRRQGSAVMTSMSRADCLLIVPRGDGRLNRGERVWIEPIDF